MLTKEDFIKFIVEGSKNFVSQKKDKSEDSALPEGFDGFGFVGEETEDTATETSRFARDLMEASGFGAAQYLDKNEVILGTDPAAKYLPERVYYWSQTNYRPYQTLLFELSMNASKVLNAPLFKPQKKLEILEDALSRFVQCTLEGFSRGGEKRTAATKKGKPTETLCIISCEDDRAETEKPVNIVCFGTVSSEQESLESFHIREEAKYWEPQIRDDHLEKLFLRHFCKLVVPDKWQNAFISGEERKLARKLLDVCIESDVKDNEKRIQESAVELLEEIAGSFGLRRKGGRNGRRLAAFKLPADHDIGMDSEDLEKHGGKNPFSGITLRDEKSRLLGYIVYCLDEKKAAVDLRTHLKANNRFHNVLIIYPDGDQAELELWQGKLPLAGKLTKKGAAYQGEGEVVYLLSRFFVVSKAKVKNPTELAQELAYRARYLRKLAIKELAEENDEGPLRKLYNAFKESLVHDQTEEEFADAFAQTLTYGLLTARWMGSEQLIMNGDRFTRQNALKYLPKTSNFLGGLFETVLSLKLDEHRGRLIWLVDDIVNLLDRIDVNYVFSAGDKNSNELTDPVIHFYEPFLAEYDINLKNKRGVFFTPRPIVTYIVRSIHNLLQTGYGLKDGLASTETWGDLISQYPAIKIPEGLKTNDLFVRILDPATGTGTFLFECIEIIEHTMKDRWCKELGIVNWTDSEIIDRWNDYVPNYLLPKLVGYELMMASYSIAHLKLSFKLGETGYRMKKNDRLHIYLTNSLEPPSLASDAKLASLFETLGKEAQKVNSIKQEWRFTVVIGNPPYARSSVNKNDFLDTLLKPYKEAVRDERNIQPLSDDYIKFIKFGQYVISRTGIGVFGMITNNTFLSGRIHRGMRKCLIDDNHFVRIVNLHGSGNVNFLGAAGSLDENVFDIQQGVSISILSTDAATEEISYGEIIGSRIKKYAELSEENISFKNISPISPFYLLIPRTAAKDQKVYHSFPSLTDLYDFFNVSGKPGDDKLLVSFKKNDVILKLKNFRKDYEKNKSKKLTEAGRKFFGRSPNKEFSAESIIPYNYRPFDTRYTYYDSSIWTRAVKKLYECIDGEPILLTTKIVKDSNFSHVFVSRIFTDVIFLSNTSSVNCYSFPSRLPSGMFNFEATSGKDHDNNLKTSRFEKIIGRKVSKEASIGYIYSILHSPEYRRRYKEQLQLDFPRIPITSISNLFYFLSKIGLQLISFHLMEFDKNTFNRHDFKGKVDQKIEKISYLNDTVWVDKKFKCGFGGISEDIWNFYIGGYRVCEKWLKDRKDRILTKQDIEHYQKIIVAISETIRLQTEIDKIIDEHGGWPGAFVTDKGGST